MLCYALETLENYKTDKFDVVVFYTIPDINLKKHKFLGNYKIQKRFPWVKFLQSKYEDKDIHLHKWFNLKDVFALGYNNVFYLDCDIIFSKEKNFKILLKCIIILFFDLIFHLYNNYYFLKKTYRFIRSNIYFFSKMSRK